MYGMAYLCNTPCHLLTSSHIRLHIHKIFWLCHSLSLMTPSGYLISYLFKRFEGSKHFVYSRSSFLFPLYIQMCTFPSHCNICFSSRFKTSHTDVLLLGYWRLVRGLAASLCCGSCLLYSAATECSYSDYTGRSLFILYSFLYSDYTECAYSDVSVFIFSNYIDCSLFIL